MEEREFEELEQENSIKELFSSSNMRSTKDTKKPKEPVLTSSMLLFTPEERENRRIRRLEKSGFCLGESMKKCTSVGFSFLLFDSLLPAFDLALNQHTEPLSGERVKVKESLMLTSTPIRQISMGVLYDPHADKRRQFLNKKFNHLLNTYSMIREAPLPPYIRPTPPKELHKYGRGKTVPEVIINVRPDIVRDMSLPSTYATAKKWTQISNLNFIDNSPCQNQGTQTPFSWLGMLGFRLSPKFKASIAEPDRTSFKIMSKRESSRRYNSINPENQLEQTEKKTPDAAKMDIQPTLHWKDVAQKYEEQCAPLISEPSYTAHVQPPTYTEGEFDLEDIPLDDMGNPIGMTTGFCEWCGNHILPIPDPSMIKTVWDKSSLYCCNKYMEMINEILSLEGKLQKLQASKKLVVKSHSKFKTIIKTIVVPKRTSQASTKDESVDTFDLAWDPFATKLDILEEDYFPDRRNTYMYADIVAMASGTYINDMTKVFTPSSMEIEIISSEQRLVE